MAASTFVTLLLSATLTLTFPLEVASNDDRLQEELKCLSKPPEDQCNLRVVYGSLVGELQCDYFSPPDTVPVLAKQPNISMTDPPSDLTDGVLIMFDPDAPVSSSPKDGYIHWIAEVKIDYQGAVTVPQDKVRTEYEGPYPPVGSTHRYQFFLFTLPQGKTIEKQKSGKFQLCPFVQKYDLAQPVAAFQFRTARY